MTDTIITQEIRKVFVWRCSKCNKENVETHLPDEPFLHCNKCGRIHRKGELRHE